MSEKAEPKWHPASEKPQNENASYVVLAEFCDGNLLHFDATYEEGRGFMFFDDKGFGDCWWSPIREKLIGWMYQEELQEYLISLHI
jgi:hypothetical protein